MDIEGALTVARLITELGVVDGRKRLQKIVHLLKSKGHPEFKQRFILHYYGPFSRQLAAQIDFVCAAELVGVDRAENGGFRYQARGEEGRSQILELTGGGSEPPEWAEFAETLDAEPTDMLEAVSTLVYLHDAGMGGEKLHAEFEKTKPLLQRRYADAHSFAEEHSLLRA